VAAASAWPYNALPATIRPASSYLTLLQYRKTFLFKVSFDACFPYSLPSVGPGADSGVRVVSPQVTVSHPPGGRLPLLSARPAVTFPAAEHHRSLTGTSYTDW